MQRKIYEVISLICYDIKKIRFQNNHIISQNIIMSQKIYEVISLKSYVEKKIKLKNNNLISSETNRVT